MKALYFTLFTILYISCGSNTKLTTASSTQNFLAVQELAKSGSFEVDSQFAQPRASAALSRVANTNILGYGNNASSINIINNPNYLKKIGDSVSAYLPYYGERTIPLASRDLGGIEFHGVPKDYKIILDEKRKLTRISFNIDDFENPIEKYDVEILLYSTYASEIKVSSASRSPISYTGSFKEIK